MAPFHRFISRNHRMASRSWTLHLVMLGWLAPLASTANLIGRRTPLAVTLLPAHQQLSKGKALPLIIRVFGHTFARMPPSAILSNSSHPVNKKLYNILTRSCWAFRQLHSGSDYDGCIQHYKPSDLCFSISMVFTLNTGSIFPTTSRLDWNSLHKAKNSTSVPMLVFKPLADNSSSTAIAAISLAPANASCGNILKNHKLKFLNMSCGNILKNQSNNRTKSSTFVWNEQRTSLINTAAITLPYYASLKTSQPTLTELTCDLPNTVGSIRSTCDQLELGLAIDTNQTHSKANPGLTTCSSQSASLVTMGTCVQPELGLATGTNQTHSMLNDRADHMLKSARFIHYTQ